MAYASLNASTASCQTFDSTAAQARRVQMTRGRKRGVAPDEREDVLAFLNSLTESEPGVQRALMRRTAWKDEKPAATAAHRAAVRRPSAAKRRRHGTASHAHRNPTE